LGGAEGLAAVSTLLSGPVAETQDAAVRALSRWTDFPAVKPLLDIATNPSSKQNHYVLAIQGIARLITTADVTPVEERADAALQAMAAARRDEEKKLVLSALGTVPHPRAIELIRPLLGDPSFKTEAGLAGAALAQRMAKTNPAAAQDLAKAVRAANISREINRQIDRMLKQ